MYYMYTLLGSLILTVYFKVTFGHLRIDENPGGPARFSHEGAVLIDIVVVDRVFGHHTLTEFFQNYIMNY